MKMKTFTSRLALAATTNGGFTRGAALPLAVLFAMTATAGAQLAGKGAISGRVVDTTDAAIPGATIVITNNATKLSTTTTSTSAGDYAVSTLDPGQYTIVVTSPGFSKLTQNNVQVNALETVAYTPKLQVGAQDQSVTVDALPPQLETTNATLGATMENEMYSALPIEMGAFGQPDQRRATDFAFLMPGVQGNNTTGNATTNTGIVNGSGSRGAVSAVYIDGLPFVRAGGNGDPRFVWTAISVDAVDQFQVQTSGYSAIYEGQGIQNYTVKAGGVKYHGSVYEFFRNTVLDTWGFLGSTLPHKPIENSNEFGINLSGPLVPFGRLKDKLFFYGNYNAFRYASETPTSITFPTLAEQQGDFSAIGVNIYDPSTQAACTAASTNGPCRYQYGYAQGTGTGLAGNPVRTAQPVNVIPAAEFSSVALKLQSLIPALTNQNPQSNYIASNKTGLNNFSTTDRIDFAISQKNQLTLVAAIGRQASSNPVGQATAGRNVGPVPYNYNQAYAPKTAVGIIEDTYTITPHLVNQFKYGYARYNGPTFDSSNVPLYAATAEGLSNTPVGPASTSFPIVSFAGTNAPTQWGGTTPNLTLAENYSIVDNIQYVKGKHTITVGGQIAWLLYNVVNATGGSTPLTLANAVTETAAITASSNAAPKYAATTNTGLSYASFLVGQVDAVSFTSYIQQEFGTRFRAISPYVQDNWKITSKLTLDLGVRYDFFPTLKDVHDRQSFFDPNLANPVTGLAGGLNFAGTGAGTCNCDTPVKNYYKNIGPRLGAAYQLDSKTVLRASYGVMYTHGNAVGGSATTLGTLGYSAAPKFSASGQLLSTSPFTGANGAIPAYAAACGVGSGAQFGTGYTTNASYTTPGCSTASYTGTPSTIGYPDPYLGSRAPEYINYTFGFQHQWTNAFATTITYVGSQGHFLPADGTNARGFYADQLDPKYLGLNSNLNLTGAALTTYCGANPGTCPSSLSVFNTSQPLSTLLKPFPFQGVSDSFGYVANSVYNALQTSFNMRPTHGLTFMANYTWSRSIDDGGTFRTGYAIPAQFIAAGGKSFQQDRIERSVSTSNQPHHAVVTAVWDLPIGRSVLNSNRFERAILGGYKLSEIFQVFSGSPLAITGSSCQTNPAQSTCNANLNPLFAGSARMGSKHWGAGAVAGNLTGTSYITTSGGTQGAPTGPFITPSLLAATPAFPNGSPLAPSYTFANAARTAPLGLTGPGNYQLDLAMVRSFPLHLITENSKLNFRAEFYNVTNKTFFAVASTAVGNAAFGTVTTNPAYNRRAAQFSARIEF